MKKVAVSGGFDPIHTGHINLFKKAKELGDYLVIILNNDNWLITKKGYNFMNEDERKEILEELECVDEVVKSEHEIDDIDTSVCSELGDIKPDIFANGGDQKDDIPEQDTCANFGIEMEFNVGGEKSQSSSDLLDNAVRNILKSRTKNNLPENATVKEIIEGL